MREWTDTVNKVEIYTDGACIGNPGSGGWGAILETTMNGQVHTRELSGGCADTTNNRMELTAVIEALSVLKGACEVELYSDSKYVTDAINKGWIHGWAKQGFKNRVNADLWVQLYNLIQVHSVGFIWVKGHGDNSKNNACDRMAKAKAKETHNNW